MTTAERLLRSDEVARRLAVSPRTVQRLAQKGALPAIRVGSLLRWEPASVTRFIRRQEWNADALSALAAALEPVACGACGVPYTPDDVSDAEHGHWYGENYHEGRAHSAAFGSHGEEWTFRASCSGCEESERIHLKENGHTWTVEEREPQ